MTRENLRLGEARSGTPWKKWGPDLSERQWGTVREDYSGSGDAWNCFTHDEARSRAYRWGEDGLGGISAGARTAKQRQAHRSEAAASPEACLVDPLQAASGGPTRDLALFDRAIDSKLRGCDVARRKVEEVAPQGVAAARCEWR